MRTSTFMQIPKDAWLWAAIPFFFSLSVFCRPMDLSSIKRRLSKGHIQSVMQFQCDLMLMFQNAVMYNSSDHHVFHVAVEMQREVLEQLQVLAEALLLSRDRLE